MAATKTKKKKTDNKKMMQALQFIMPLLLIGLGVLLIRRRDALNQVFMAIGIVIALIGLIYTVVYYATKQYEKKPPYLASGIGLLIILISGITGLMDAFQLKKFSSDWQIPLAFSVLITLMGVAVLICTFYLSGVVWIIIGIMLIVSGLMRFINAIISANARKKQIPDDVIEGEATEV